MKYLMFLIVLVGCGSNVPPLRPWVEDSKGNKFLCTRAAIITAGLIGEECTNPNVSDTTLRFDVLLQEGAIIRDWKGN